MGPDSYSRVPFRRPINYLKRLRAWEHNAVPVDTRISSRARWMTLLFDDWRNERRVTGRSDERCERRVLVTFSASDPPGTAPG